MKKNLGSMLALYPMPVTVVGVMTEEGRPNWMVVAHVGIIGHDRLMISCAKPHFTNTLIKKAGVVCINLVNEQMLPRADFAGSVSGAREDKSELFAYTRGEGGSPVINDAPLAMECTVIKNHETETFDNFILRIDTTYVEEDALTDEGKPDYGKMKPVMFEFPTYSYLRSGERIGKCTTLGKDLRK